MNRELTSACAHKPSTAQYCHCSGYGAPRSTYRIREILLRQGHIYNNATFSAPPVHFSQSQEQSRDTLRHIA